MKSKISGWRYLWTSIDIRRKLLYTLGFLALYRLAANVPVPGVDRVALDAFRASGAGGSMLGFLDLLSGGTVSQFSLLSMGVYPYITAQIILQLLTPIIPALQQRMEDDPREGQKWMEKWTYILAVPMAMLSAIGQVNIFNSFATQSGLDQIVPFGFSNGLILPSLTVLFAMTAGTMFAIWLGELISEYGMRKQGLSLIIFSGIVVSLPNNLVRMMNDEQNRWLLLAMTIGVLIATIYAVVVVQQGQRNVPVMYPGRRMGNRMSMPVKGSLPLKVNMAGMIPLIFASAILQFPAILSSYFVNSETDWVARFSLSVQSTFDGTGGTYWLIYFVMVVLFTFFYTDVLFAQQNYGENLKRMGAQIPGVNRGAPTQRYLTKVQRRITLPGALFLGLVAILPYLMQFIMPISSQGSGLMLVSSAGLLIVVGVVRDVFQNIDAELKLHGYQDSILVK
ncbi:MAG TPA: preprotein translocase subunit SecY [Anaerolineales bacterium]|nr:preprotein translocase subunit SecY [Anaerolineales bacterium]